MAFKQYRFTVENPAGAKTAFLGDGHSVAEAFQDGVKNLARQDANGLTVERKGAFETMSLPVFESHEAPTTPDPEF